MVNPKDIAGERRRRCPPRESWTWESFAYVTVQKKKKKKKNPTIEVATLRLRG